MRHDSGAGFSLATLGIVRGVAFKSSSSALPFGTEGDDGIEGLQALSAPACAAEPGAPHDLGLGVGGRSRPSLVGMTSFTSLCDVPDDGGVRGEASHEGIVRRGGD